jgi:hypothetical protein
VHGLFSIRHSQDFEWQKVLFDARHPQQRAFFFETTTGAKLSCTMQEAWVSGLWLLSSGFAPLFSG